jgi:hypothetical protein
MGERLKAESFSNPSMLFYGLHTALLLVNGLGQKELAPAYDPRPARGNVMLQPTGDPFEDPHRALRLTLASDCRWLDPRTYEDLVKLSAYPNVAVDLVPGLPSLGYDSAHVATASVNPRSGRDVVVVTTPRRPNASSSGVRPHGGDEALRRTLHITRAEARRLLLDLAVHEALGNDYIVSDVGVRARNDRRLSWPNQVGFCTATEAFGLVGAKARMFSSVPIDVWPPRSSMGVNVGMWWDQAAMTSAWGVRRALGGALSPGASPEERATRNHLLAIRSLLKDALVARDEVFRLTRRDSGAKEQRRYAREASPGAHGNDLLQLLRYHAVTMLDHVFALTDNLTWVVVRRTGTQIDREHEVGLGSLVGERKKPWARKGALGQVSARLEASHELPYLLAARRLRNASVHREGVPYGAVHFEPRPSPPLDRIFALWLDPDEWDDVIRREIGARADLAQPGMVVVVTFLRLVDELWASVVAFLNEALTLFPWSSSRWARGHESHDQVARMARAWAGSRQRLLFRFPRSQ